MTDVSTTITGLSARERRELLARLLKQRKTEPEHAPLSFAQERLWFLDQLQPRNSVYNIPSNFTLNGVPNVAALEVKIPAGFWADLKSQGLIHPEAPVPA